jgi:hypothetical protein
MTGIDRNSVTREALRSFTTRAPRDVNTFRVDAI